ncbi:MAG: type II toxin-antitoxin system HicA family toxin [Elusimicrobiota bacterium]
MKPFLKTLRAVMSGAADANIRFYDLCRLLQAVGFRRRIRGDHYIFVRDGVVEILNLQPLGSKAKPYQVEQTRKLFKKYHLEEIDDLDV